MIVTAYKINAFAKTKNGGNPAGVVIDEVNLTDNEMKKVAMILGLSETAFVTKSDVADYKVRFFTPTDEVDLCGHASIGTFSTLLSKGLIIPGQYTQETKAGILNIEVFKDTTIMMNQNLPEFSDFINPIEIAESLNISMDDLDENLPIQIVSTGLRDIIVPVKNLKILNGIRPDFKKVSEISEKYKVVGYHIFTKDSLYQSNAHCRNIAPLYGINEESATGTASGALACYLHKQGRLQNDKLLRLIFEQGYLMSLPSEILVTLIIEDDKVVEVKVGGKASNLVEIQVEI